MRINFNQFNHAAAEGNNQSVEDMHLQGIRWPTVLMQLLADSKCNAFDEKFDLWISNNWGIQLLRESQKTPALITAIELDESAITMVLLKFK